ncbi:Por secretion system C-terminal sorting domain-containing protein [Flaviramulus basaltis]|uniref:Por secretion system C-terminal sorting domain-containing protein n=1 Tax=Flaviramulus basaltis TaxID=369401 RepID=A0A1K2IDF4_9FLAO|nr:Por secretion system C-terminal sorting domain-containing protein [Flaviramulus basaltis]
MHHLVSIKTPRRYIPVSQGFFVTATTSGNTKFENNQRVFVTETSNTNSWFLKESSSYKKLKNQNNIEEDIRPKFRIGYNSPNGYDRQLLLTIDENTTMSYDWGYEAPLIENNLEDMFWNIDESKYIIQGINSITETTILPIGVKTFNGGSITIHIDALENVSDDVSIYLKDHGTNTLHDLRTSPYTTNVNSGILNERFEIVFVSNSLSNNEADLKDSLNLFYNASNTSIVISNAKNIEIKKLKGVNILGQNVLEKNLNSTESQIIMPINLATGVYVFIVQTSEIKITKKHLYEALIELEN